MKITKEENTLNFKFKRGDILKYGKNGVGSSNYLDLIGAPLILLLFNLNLIDNVGIMKYSLHYSV